MLAAGGKAGSEQVSFHGFFTAFNSQLNNQNDLSQQLSVDRERTVQKLNRIKRNLCNLAKDLDVAENSSMSSGQKRKFEEDKSPRYSSSFASMGFILDH